MWLDDSCRYHIMSRTHYNTTYNILPNYSCVLINNTYWLPSLSDNCFINLRNPETTAKKKSINTWQEAYLRSVIGNIKHHWYYNIQSYLQHNSTNDTIIKQYNNTPSYIIYIIHHIHHTSYIIYILCIIYHIHHTSYITSYTATIQHTSRVRYHLYIRTSYSDKQDWMRINIYI